MVVAKARQFPPFPSCVDRTYNWPQVPHVVAIRQFLTPEFDCDCLDVAYIAKNETYSMIRSWLSRPLVEYVSAWIVSNGVEGALVGENPPLSSRNSSGHSDIPPSWYALQIYDAGTRRTVEGGRFGYIPPASADPKAIARCHGHDGHWSCQLLGCWETHNSLNLNNITDASMAHSQRNSSSTLTWNVIHETRYRKKIVVTG